MNPPASFVDTLANLSLTASSLSVKLLHWSYGTTSKKSPIQEPPCKCESLNELAVKLYLLPIVLSSIKNTVKAHQEIFKDAEMVERFGWVTQRCDRVLKVLTSGVEIVQRSISEENEKARFSGEELWRVLISSVGNETGMQNLRKSFEKSKSGALVMESLVWLAILQVRGKKNLSFKERERVDCLDLNIESLYHDLSAANMISIPFALATGIKAPPRTKPSSLSRPKHRGKNDSLVSSKDALSFSTTPTLVGSTITEVHTEKDLPFPRPRQHYEAFTICTMHTSSTTTHDSNSIFKFFTRKSTRNNFSHLEWGALACSQEEIKSYLRNHEPNPKFEKIEGDKSKRWDRGRWQYPMSTMEILLQLPAEVAWSVSNILDSRVEASERERDWKGEKRSWSVELAAEWPVSGAAGGGMERGKQRIQFKGRRNLKAQAEADLKKMQHDGLRDYLVILRSATHGKEITVPKYESKAQPFPLAFRSGVRTAPSPSTFAERAKTRFSEKEERREKDVGEEELSMKQKAMIINDFLASFSTLYDGGEREERAELMLKIANEC
ncbi:hypothetical protein BDZ45DRAFT_229958 [Acephala macrosclerotiorum]|nr:hypothetical protein BDZ45DRAFT_229958 [Acephala macrosclerotiorum]